MGACNCVRNEKVSLLFCALFILFKVEGEKGKRMRSVERVVENEDDRGSFRMRSHGGYFA